MIRSAASTALITVISIFNPQSITQKSYSSATLSKKLFNIKIWSFVFSIVSNALTRSRYPFAVRTSTPYSDFLIRSFGFVYSVSSSTCSKAGDMILSDMPCAITGTIPEATSSKTPNVIDAFPWLSASTSKTFLFCSFAKRYASDVAVVVFPIPPFKPAIHIVFMLFNLLS